MIDRFSAILFSAILVFVLICAWPKTSLAREEQNPAPSGSSASATAAVVGNVNVSPRPDGLTIEISLSTPVVPTTVRLTNPDRLVLDFPGCQLQGANRHIPVNRGPVQELRMSLFQVQPPVTRVVVASKLPLNSEVKPAGNKVVIEITFPQGTPVPADVTRQLPALAKEPPAKEPPAKERPAQTSPPRDKQAAREKPIREKPIRASGSQLHVYTLMTKAKALTVEDLAALEEKAAAGDPEAQTMFALAYHAGVLLKQDDAEALRLLHKAADGRFTAAEESLGIFAETGIGMAEPAPAEALDWYKKAVEQGSLDAATNIALMYADGKGVAKDPAQALSWFHRAAEGGDATAQYNLALIYSRGSGVPKDTKESVRWLTAAADQDLVPALLALADSYLNPADAAAADVGRAVHYYQRAAELGSAPAQAMLGNIYANGRQGHPDYEQAVKWYRMSADQGHREGQFGLAVRYAFGQGVPVNMVEARRLFAAAADQGQVIAQYDLGTMCEEGKGAPADPSLAAHYYQLAAEQGSVKAQFRLGRLLARRNESPDDRIAAYKWLMLAQDSVQESSAVLSELKKSMNQQEVTTADHEVDNWRVAHTAAAPQAAHPAREQ